MVWRIDRLLRGYPKGGDFFSWYVRFGFYGGSGIVSFSLLFGKSDFYLFPAMPAMYMVSNLFQFSRKSNSDD